MKFVFLAVFTFSVSALASDEACRNKVISYHKDVYHRTHGAASSTFLNNFVGRKNMLAYTFAYPSLAFIGYANQNPIAEKMIVRAECSSKSMTDLISEYEKALASGELCADLGEDYKKPRKIRAYLYRKLAI